MMVPCIHLAYILLWALTKGADCQANVASSPGPACSSQPCSCCLDTATCPIDGNCGGQCKDGYFGGKCLNQCPTNCIRCMDHPDVSTTDDTHWKKGYCTECKDGYYSTTEFYQCQVACYSGCQTCASSAKCISCKDGYTLEGAMCRQCQTGCVSCTSYVYCSQCDDGYYNSGGTDNNLSCVVCSNGCRSQCDQASGTCLCKSAFYTGEKCDKCIDGMSGEDCHIPCQTGYATCTSTSKCTSCKYGYYLFNTTCKRCKSECVHCISANTCIQCIHGYYGDTCSLACSSNCLYGNCEYTTGACIGGCTSGYTGDMCCLRGSNCKTCSSVLNCSKCEPGKHGESCGNDCPANCGDNICNKDNGDCYRCIDGFQGDNCAVFLAITDSETGRPRAAIGGGVAGGLVVIIIGVVVIVVVYRRRLGSMSDRQADSNTGIPTYINDIPAAAIETQGNRKAIHDKTRKLQKYQQHQLKYHQKEVEYAEKALRIQYELKQMRGQPISREIEDDANSGTMNSTYESLQEAGDRPYAALGNKYTL